MLVKKIALTVNGYTVKLSQSILLYRHDAVHLSFTLTELLVDVVNRKREIVTINPLNAFLIIEQPNDQASDTIEAVSIEDNEVVFHIDSKYTSNTGTGRIQIILTDNNCCRVALPEFDYEVKENIYGEELLKVVDTAYVDIDHNTLMVDENGVISTGLMLTSKDVGFKTVNDLPLLSDISTNEILMVQDGDKIKRLSMLALYNYIIANFETTIRQGLIDNFEDKKDELMKLVNDLNQLHSASLYMNRLYDEELQQLQILRQEIEASLEEPSEGE